jgi:hypothetical protein
MVDRRTYIIFLLSLFLQCFGMEKSNELSHQENLKDAQDRWEKAEKDLESARKKYEESLRQEEKYREMKQADPQSLKVGSELDDAIKATSTDRTAMEKAQETISELERDPYIQEYKNKLARNFEPKNQLDSFAKSAKNWLERGLRNLQVSLNSFVGNKQAANEAREALISLYTDLGDQGLLKKAQMQRELAKEVDAWELKIKNHIDALNSYLQAWNAQAIDRGKVNDEAENILADLMGISKQLNSQYDFEGKKIDMSKQKAIIQAHADTIIDTFQISPLDHVLMVLEMKLLPSAQALIKLKPDQRNSFRIKPFIGEQNKKGWIDYDKDIREKLVKEFSVK